MSRYSCLVASALYLHWGILLPTALLALSLGLQQPLLSAFQLASLGIGHAFAFHNFLSPPSPCRSAVALLAVLLSLTCTFTAIPDLLHEPLKSSSRPAPVSTGNCTFVPRSGSSTGCTYGYYATLTASTADIDSTVEGIVQGAQILAGFLGSASSYDSAKCAPLIRETACKIFAPKCDDWCRIQPALCLDDCRNLAQACPAVLSSGLPSWWPKGDSKNANSWLSSAITQLISTPSLQSLALDIIETMLEHPCQDTRVTEQSCYPLPEPRGNPIRACNSSWVASYYAQFPEDKQQTEGWKALRRASIATAVVSAFVCVVLPWATVALSCRSRSDRRGGGVPDEYNADSGRPRPISAVRVASRGEVFLERLPFFVLLNCLFDILIVASYYLAWQNSHRGCRWQTAVLCCVQLFVHFLFHFGVHGVWRRQQTVAMVWTDRQNPLVRLRSIRRSAVVLYHRLSSPMSLGLFASLFVECCKVAVQLATFAVTATTLDSWTLVFNSVLIGVNLLGLPLVVAGFRRRREFASVHIAVNQILNAAYLSFNIAVASFCLKLVPLAGVALPIVLLSVAACSVVQSNFFLHNLGKVTEIVISKPQAALWPSSTEVSPESSTTASAEPTRPPSAAASSPDRRISEIGLRPVTPMTPITPLSPLGIAEALSSMKDSFIRLAWVVSFVLAAAGISLIVATTARVAVTQRDCKAIVGSLIWSRVPHVFFTDGYLKPATCGFDKVTSLDLHALGLKCFPSVIFFQFPNVESIDLSQNELETLPDLGPLNKLGRLNAQKNSITRLQFSFFTNLPDTTPLVQLQFNPVWQALDLGNQGLNGTLSPAVPTLLPELQQLTLTGNNFLKFPPELLQLTDLRIIDVSQNSIRDIPVELLARLPALQKLNASGNPLLSTGLLGSDAPRLQSPLLRAGGELDVSNAKLTLVPVTPHTRLLLYGNPIDTMAWLGQGITALDGRVFAQLPLLRYVDLSGNLQLSTLPPEFFDLPLLDSLFLSLTAFSPDAVRQIAMRHSGLVVLALAGNGLASVPPEIGNLRKLVDLTLTINAFKTLPDEICGLPAIRSLVLGSGELESLPECIGNLTSLQQLMVNSNRLTRVPASLRNLTALRFLGFTGNNLTSIDQAVLRLPNLRRLELGNNPGLKLNLTDFAQRLPPALFLHNTSADVSVNFCANFAQAGVEILTLDAARCTCGQVNTCSAYQMDDYSVNWCTSRDLPCCIGAGSSARCVL